MSQYDENESIDLSNTSQNSSYNISPNQTHKTEKTYDSNTPKGVELMMKYSGGLVKNEKQANLVLVGLVALMIISSFFLIFSGAGNSKENKFSPEGQIFDQE